jgi:hypothetical protein
MRKPIVLLLLVLSGCATTEQRAAQVIAEYGPYCERLGYQRNTDPWRQCIQIEDAKNSVYYPPPFIGPWHCEGGLFCPPF